MPSNCNRAMREASSGRTVTDTDSYAFLVYEHFRQRGDDRGNYLIMKYFTAIALSFGAAVIALSVSAVTPKRRTSTISNKSPIVNIQAVQDSIILLADNYADAMERKPEMANIHLNALKNYYALIPTSEAKDSARNKLFDFYVFYVGQDNEIRACDFKNCYLAIAKDDDENLGPMYVMDLAVAQDNFDTISVKKTVAMLENYARQLDVDYDADVQTANEFLYFMRNKRPIQEAMMGAWVCEDVFRESPRIVNDWVDLLKILTLQTTSMEDGSFDFDRQTDSHDIIYMQLYGPEFYPKSLRYVDFIMYGYDIPKESIISNSKSDRTFLNRTPNGVLYDENSRSMYCFQSTQNTVSFDSNFSANLRQQLQNNRAALFGEHARKKYSYGQRFKGETKSEIIHSLGNAWLDRLNIATAFARTKEVELFHVNNRIMKGWVKDTYLKSVSNKSNTMVFDRTHEDLTYLKWLPNDSVFFLKRNDYIILGDMNKTNKNYCKRVINEYKLQYRKEEKRQKNAGMGIERFDLWFNRKMYNKLKTKILNEE